VLGGAPGCVGAVESLDQAPRQRLLEGQGVSLAAPQRLPLVAQGLPVGADREALGDQREAR